MLLTRLDGLSKIAWLAITAAAFVVTWPLGLALLAYLVGSGRLQAWYKEYAGTPGTWFNLGRGAPASRSETGGHISYARSSGNKAFDDCHSDTLSRLEKERHEFQAHLERQHKARGKAEFDAFVAKLRQRVANADAAGPVGTPA